MATKFLKTENNTSSYIHIYFQYKNAAKFFIKFYRVLRAHPCNTHKRVQSFCEQNIKMWKQFLSNEVVIIKTKMKDC